MRCPRQRSASASMTRLNSTGSARTGVMSLKTTPFFGKSGTSRIRARTSFMGGSLPDGRSGEIEEGVPRPRPLADLEVQVRTRRAPRAPDLRDGLPRRHRLPLLDEERARVRVHGEEPGRVAQDDDRAVARLAPRVDDGPRRGGADRRALR